MEQDNHVSRMEASEDISQERLHETLTCSCLRFHQRDLYTGLQHYVHDELDGVLLIEPGFETSKV